MNEVDETRLDSAAALLDYNVLFYDAVPYLSEAVRPSMQAISSTDATNVTAQLYRRHEEIIDFLKHGRLVIYFPFAPVPYKTWNAHGTIIESGIADPMFKERLPAAIGREMECAANAEQPIRDFFTRLAPLFRYRTYLPAVDFAKPALYVKGTQKCVGAYSPKELRLLLFPQLDTKGGRESKRVIEAVTQLSDEFIKKEPLFILPPWHKEFVVPAEKETTDTIRALESSINELQTKAKASEATLTKIQDVKRLFLAKDQLLVDAVTAALSDLGISVGPGPKVKDDLIGQYGATAIVIEVKGRDTKGAAEKDAQQLEKWVSNYYLENGKHAKGILVVNGFKDIPLDKRADPVFPDDMIKYSAKRDHCLISGLQLLCLCLESRGDPRNEENAVNRLLNCVGLFPDYLGESWKDVIQVLKGDVTRQ